MGSSTTEETEIKEKIKTYRQFINVSYEIFNGKYTIDDISKMPYKKLLVLLDEEHELQKKKAKEMKRAQQTASSNSKNRMRGGIYFG